MRPLLVVAVLTLPSPLRAGARLDAHTRVFRDASHPSANGSLGSARRTLDNLDEVWCQIEVGGFPWEDPQPRATCQAYQPIRLEIVDPYACYFTKHDSPDMWRALLALDGQSYVYFSWHRINSGLEVCDNLEVLNSSVNEPVAP